MNSMVIFALTTSGVGYAIGLPAASTATAYCACMKCCGKTDGLTASGRFAKVGETVAHKTLPFGTKVRLVLGSGSVIVRTVEDRMNSRNTAEFDIYYRSHRKAKAFGRQKIKRWEVINK